MKIPKEMYLQVIKDLSDTGIELVYRGSDCVTTFLSADDAVEALSLLEIPILPFMEWKKNKGIRCIGVQKNGKRCRNLVHKNLSFQEFKQKWHEWHCKKHEYQQSLAYLSDNPDILDAIENETGFRD